MKKLEIIRQIAELEVRISNLEREHAYTSAIRLCDLKDELEASLNKGN